MFGGGYVTGQTSVVDGGATLPKAGFEILSSHGRTVECEVRMLKGAMAAEEARWNRPSVRRPVFAKQAAAGLGFRLVRDLDP